MKKIFEIPVYNEEVRETVRSGRSHDTLEDTWADMHLIEVRAHTPVEAMEICRRKHPEKMGFVLGDAAEAMS
ncbi:hypothetical protein [Emcibacter sp.]|uniref:hypothetical protein n=1 Tax=Emcibacter sp. TaxID=1979954 RepID=UPI002AA62E4F|nr:hypothetical protein [Emcibacter sp.]